MTPDTAKSHHPHNCHKRIELDASFDTSAGFISSGFPLSMVMCLCALLVSHMDLHTEASCEIAVAVAASH